jgi:hypothetical protein
VGEEKVRLFCTAAFAGFGEMDGAGDSVRFFGVCSLERCADVAVIGAFSCL